MEKTPKKSRNYDVLRKAFPKGTVEIFPNAGKISEGIFVGEFLRKFIGAFLDKPHLEEYLFEGNFVRIFEVLSEYLEKFLEQSRVELFEDSLKIFVKKNHQTNLLRNAWRIFLRIFLKISQSIFVKKL